MAYESVGISDGAGTLEITDIAGDEVLSVVVVALADTGVEGETFNYRYALGDSVPDTEDIDIDTGSDTGDGGSEPTCGCRSGSAAVLWLFPLYGSFRSRRRKTVMPSPSAKRCS